MEFFANIVDCIQPLTIFAKYSILGVSQGKCAFYKTKQKLEFLEIQFLSLHYYPTVRLNSSKFNTRVFDFKSIHPCSWKHMILNSHHIPVQTHPNNFRLTLSNFFGECEEIHSKLHSFVPKLLQWVWAPSVGSKSFCD